MEKIKELKEEFLEKMKDGWVLITHGSCNDGTASAMVAQHYALANNLPEPKIIFSQYGFKHENYELDGKVVIMADFAFEHIEDNEALNERADCLIVLDHHETLIKRGVDKLPYVYYNNDKSGCRLIHEFFHGVCEDHELPQVVLHVEDRDLWNWKYGRSSRVFAALIKSKSTKFLIDNVMDLFSIDSRLLPDMYVKGEGVVDYQDAIIESAAKKKSNVPIVTMDGFKGPMSNSTHLISELGNMLAEDNDFSLQYFIQKDKIIFSLRSIGDKCNVRAMAMKIAGGGGHANSAGFSIPLTDFDFDEFFIGHEIDVRSYAHLFKDERARQIGYGEIDVEEQ